MTLAYVTGKIVGRTRQESRVLPLTRYPLRQECSVSIATDAGFDITITRLPAELFDQLPLDARVSVQLDVVAAGQPPTPATKGGKRDA